MNTTPTMINYSGEMLKSLEPNIRMNADEVNQAMINYVGFQGFVTLAIILYGARRIMVIVPIIDGADMFSVRFPREWNNYSTIIAKAPYWANGDRVRGISLMYIHPAYKSLSMVETLNAVLDCTGVTFEAETDPGRIL